MANEFKVKHGLIVNGSGSTVLDVQGSQGQLFSITDSLSGSLFSVGDISGIPILEVFSDDTVKLGSFGSEAIIVSGSHATVSGSFSGSFEGDGSQLTGILTSTPTLQQVTDQGAITDNNVSITGVLNVSGSYSDPGAMLTLFNTNNAAGASISFNDNLAATQTGLLTYRHSDADSLGGGASFHFTAQPDTVLVVGDSTNGGRFAAYSGNSAAEVDYGFAGDSNTGMYQASVDNLGFVTSGTERIRILANGSVGIGTTSPNVTLEVGGDVRLTTNGDELQFGNSNVGVFRGDSNKLVLGGYGGIDFNASNTTGISNQTLRMRINDTGQIGIGTNPSTGTQVYILHPSSSAGLDVFVSQSSQPTSPQFRVGRDAGQYYGVFTDDGIAHLVHRQDETGATTHTVSNEIWSSGTGIKRWQWKIGDNTGTPLSTKMTLNKDGDLDVAGDITGSNDLLLDGSRIHFTGGSTLIRSLDSYFGVFTTGGSAKSVKAKSIQLSTNYTGTLPDNGILFGTDTTLYRSDTTTLTTNGDLVVEGSVTAQEFHTEFVSSSIIYQSGSTKFGDTVDDNHDFTGSINLSGSINLKDNSFLYLGDSNDLQLYHNGTNSTIANYTGHLYIGNNANDKNIILQSDDGSGGITSYLTIDGVATTVNFSKNAFFGDNIKGRFGNNYDLDIYHDGSDSFIENFTGQLTIKQRANDSDIIFESDDGSGGTTEYLRLDGSNERLNVDAPNGMLFSDNIKLKAGTGGDLEFYHNGTNSVINNITNNLQIINNADDGDISFQSDDGSGGTAEYFRLDGGDTNVQFAKNIKLNGGADIYLADNGKTHYGNSNDLEVFHDGSNSYITAKGTGHLYIQQTTDDNDIIFRSDDGSGGTTDYLTLDGSAKKIMIGDGVNVQYDGIGTSNNGTVVRGGFLNPASEANMVHIPHIINDLAGFNKWSNGTITTSGFYKTRGGSAGSYTYSDEVLADDSGWGNAFDAHSSTAGSWYSDNGTDGTFVSGSDTPGVVTLEWPNEAQYSLWVGIVFGAGSFTATYVKIEAYRGGAWQELCEITDNTDQIVLRQVANNSGTGASTTKLRYTLGGSVNGSYFRIHSLYMANYRAGDNNLNSIGTDITRGVNFIEKYKNGYIHGNFSPGADNTYDLGASGYAWKDGYFESNIIFNGTGRIQGIDTVSAGTDAANKTYVDNAVSGLGTGTVDGSGAANKVAIWSDSDTLTSDTNLHWDTSNDRLGIGTASPEAPLHVKGNKFLLERSGSNDAYVEVNTTDAGAYFTANSEGSPGYYGLELKHGSTAKWFIGSYGTNFLEIINGAKSSGTKALVIDTNNKVGIATSTPDSVLHVYGSTSTGNTDNGITIENAGTGDAIMQYLLPGVRRWVTGIDNSDNDSFKIASSADLNTDAILTIRTDGDVGIGTTSPNQKLTVAGNITQTSNSYLISTRKITARDGSGLSLYNDGGAGIDVKDNGNVGIGTDTPQATLHVEGNITGSGNIDINGTLTAAVKSFDIPHPTQEGKRLVYGVLEGPEHAVYVRGESKADTIILPEEWVGLVDETTITVQLTPIGSPDIYYYQGYEDNTVKVGGPQEKNYFYYIQATRKDIEPLTTVQ